MNFRTETKIRKEVLAEAHDKLVVKAAVSTHDKANEKLDYFMAFAKINQVNRQIRWEAHERNRMPGRMRSKACMRVWDRADSRVTDRVPFTRCERKPGSE